ncbi:hypothetical protein [Nocardiopsis alba]|uniref:hypothetical protein n=1 Tax=Nocardiopsis alba TaxID=53437 RepID=UPI00363C8096
MSIFEDFFQGIPVDAPVLVQVGFESFPDVGENFFEGFYGFGFLDVFFLGASS